MATTKGSFWVDVRDIQVGDVLCRQFGGDSDPVVRIEELDHGRRLVYADGRTTRVTPGNHRIRRP